MWGPLSQAVRADLEHFLRRQLELQPHPEATLLLLAQLGARPPDGCSNGSAESSDNEEISVGTLRPGLVRLLWTSPSNLVPTVLAEVLALPGKPHEDPGHAQRTARNLEQSIPTKEQSEAEKVLFQSWRDESDIGIVQEALKLLASVAHQPARKEALQAIKAARAPKPRRARSKTNHASQSVGKGEQ